MNALPPSQISICYLSDVPNHCGVMFGTYSLRRITKGVRPFRLVWSGDTIYRKQVRAVLAEMRAGVGFSREFGPSGEVLAALEAFGCVQIERID